MYTKILVTKIMTLCTNCFKQVAYVSACYLGCNYHEDICTRMVQVLCKCKPKGYNLNYTNLKD
jgi:hypothetical protein